MMREARRSTRITLFEFIVPHGIKTHWTEQEEGVSGAGALVNQGN